MRVHLGAIGAAVLLLAMTIPAAAQDRDREVPPPGPPNPILGPAAGLLRGLDLTSEQRDRLHALVREAMDGDLGEVSRAFGEARHALEIAVWDPAATPARIEAAAAAVAEKSVGVEAARHVLATEILSVLTEEQRSIFRARLAEGPPVPPGPLPPGVREGRRRR